MSRILITFFKIFIKYPMLHCNEHGEQTLTAKYFVTLFFLKIFKNLIVRLEKEPLPPKFLEKYQVYQRTIFLVCPSTGSLAQYIFRIKLTPLVLEIK